MRIKHSQGDFKKEDLPKTRVDLFFDLLKVNTSVLFGMGAIIFLFSLPFLIVSFICDYSLATIFVNITNSEIGDEEIALMISSTISFYDLIKIPCYIVLGIGASGIMQVIRRLVWGEGVMLSQDFFDGIKSNALTYSICFLVFGLINYLDGFIFRRLGGSNFFAYAPLIVSVVFLLPIGLFILSQSIIYSNRFHKYVYNGFILYFKSFFRTLIASIVFFVILSVGLISDLIIKYILLTVFFFAIIPILMTIWFLYSCFVFDKYINKENHPDIYGKGLYLKKYEKDK